MNSGFLKTLALAIVLTAVLIIAVNVIGDFAVRPNPGYSPGQVTEKQPAAQEPTTQKSAPVKEPEAMAEDLPTLLAKADPEQGKKTFRRCKGCHTVIEGARNLVGPNLWNVVGRAKGSTEGYKYSQTVGGLGGEWSYDDLDAFLTNPRAYAKGTKMMFKGLKKPAQRASVIAYLRTLSDNPKPLP